MAMTLEAIEKQILANQKPFDVIPYFPHTLSIIEAAAIKLPSQMRDDMLSAIEDQYEEKCSLGAGQAILEAQTKQLPKRQSVEYPLVG